MSKTNIPFIKVKSISFKNGTKFEIGEDDIILFVGANNVGKSRTLKDIKDKLISANANLVLVENIQFNEYYFDFDSMRHYFQSHLTLNNNGSYEFITEDDCITYIGLNQVENALKNNDYNNLDIYQLFYTFLSTENRLNLTKPISFVHPMDNQAFEIWKTLRDDKKSIVKVNKFLNNSFKKGIDIDDAVLGQNTNIQYKIGDTDVINENLNCDRYEARKKLFQLDNLSEQGDGVRSAVAILSSLITGDNSLYLIDEPETFLHPPQARQLGKDIVELSEGKQCFISTHNIDFIRGVLETDSKRVKIIKINRNGCDNTYNLLDNKSICKIANDKTLKFSNILNGLFYKQVVLCEDESDCRFYSNILESVSLGLYQNTLFCAVGGKDQFKKVIPLLIALKIDYYIIADLDLINNRDKLKQLLNSIKDNNYDQIETSHTIFLRLFEENTNDQIKSQSEIQKKIQEIFKNAQHDKYMSDETANSIKKILKNINTYALLKDAGKGSVPSGQCRREYDSIQKYLRNNHIFLAEDGEIERLIPTVDGHGINWVERVFEEYPNLGDVIYDDAKHFIKMVFNIT